MERQITFNTTVVGGFDKKSVLKYIDELCAQNQTSIAALNDKIAEIEGSNSELAQTVGQLNEQITGFQQKLTSSAERSRSLQRTIDELSAEIERQNAIIQEKDHVLKQHQEKARQLTLRAEALEYKGKKYDETMHHIGDAFAAASQSADEIIKTAEAKAQRMTLATIESIQGLAQQVGAFKGDIGTLRNALQLSLGELEKRLDGMDLSINQLDGAIKAIDQLKLDEMSDLEPLVDDPAPPLEPIINAAEVATPKVVETVNDKAATFYW